MSRLSALTLLTLTAGCAASTPPPRAAAPIAVPRAVSTVGLERVMGRTARDLTQAFGRADADLTEPPARKLQFGSRICVLDAYLYPPRAGAEPVVRHVDTRQRDGSSIDRASCVAALMRREGGR